MKSDHAWVSKPAQITWMVHYLQLQRGQSFKLYNLSITILILIPNPRPTLDQHQTNSETKRKFAIFTQISISIKFLLAL